MSDSTAISGTRKAIKEMADGTLRIQIDIEPRFKPEFHRLFPEIDMPVAIAPLVPVAEGLIDIYEGAILDAVKPKYGQQAKELRQSSFFRRPEVWKAVGTDQEFLEWLKTEDCAAPILLHAHGGDVVPAHVRRVANGSGTGIKPLYSAIPLCNDHHQLQHQQGESAINPREWWDKKRIEYLVKWCWQKLKDDLGGLSWSDIPPIILEVWAIEHDVGSYLPRCYINTKE